MKVQFTVTPVAMGVFFESPDFEFTLSPADILTGYGRDLFGYAMGQKVILNLVGAFPDIAKRPLSVVWQFVDKASSKEVTILTFTPSDLVGALRHGTMVADMKPIDKYAGAVLEQKRGTAKEYPPHLGWVPDEGDVASGRRLKLYRRYVRDGKPVL